MADYLKQFNTTAEYNTYINGTPDLPNVSLTLDNNEVHYNPKPDYSKEYLTFEMIESGTVQFSFPPNQSWVSSMSYSLDGGETWVTKQYGEGALITPTIAAGDKVLFKGIATQVSYPNSQASLFNISANCNVSGNIMSLLYGDNFQNQTSFPSGSTNNFMYLFAESYFVRTNIVSAENLILPATTLTQQCYSGMFKSPYSKLTTAPKLPATTLVGSCYYHMFEDCNHLNSITMLATDISASSSLKNWVRNVAATGTFTKAASMTTLPTGASGIPANWTVIDA